MSPPGARFGKCPSVGIYCDAGPGIGVGHLMRCLALAEELLSRGASVRVMAPTSGIEWIPALFGPVPLEEPPPDLVASAARFDALVLDSYLLPPAVSGELRRAGLPVLAIVDGTTRGQDADIFVDQNLGAEDVAVDLPPASTHLAGLRYALLRDDVRAHARPRPRRPLDGPPRVLCVFGGTDPYGAAPAVLRLAAGTGAPFDATVIAARPPLLAELESVTLAPGQTARVIPPVADLPALAAASDVVVTASGTSIWDMLHLGVPTALTWVVDHQRDGYTATVSRGLAAGLGHVREFGPEASRTLFRLLTDPSVRAALAGHGATAVDGQGRERVADALFAALRDGAAEPTPGSRTA
ncbi:PseG/SpsG family protein [Spirillospora albida]|uniref:PseG/SpsG family protein n=1 Tax=Spirillospora albida TaxID=58123 RepID=UPI0006905F33|nr:hypothetical protein [Spirillospora albida]